MAKTSIRTQDLADGAVTGAKLSVGTTKGDIIAHNGTVAVRLAVGTDGQALTADAASAGGVKWASVLTASNRVISEVPTGTIDGTNAAFVLANTPTAGTLMIYKNGIRQNSGVGNDYTLATATVTFLTGNIPQSGDVILADYWK